MKKSLRERKARPLHFNVINSHCATRLSQKILFCCSLLSLCDCFIGFLCQRIFFFSFVCWLLKFLRFIKGTNKTDSSLHSMKSVSLILLFYFFFFRSLVVQNNNGRFLNNAWRMMNYGQEWHIKKTVSLPVYIPLLWTGISHEIPSTWPKPAWSFIIRLN